MSVARSRLDGSEAGDALSCLLLIRRSEANGPCAVLRETDHPAGDESEMPESCFGSSHDAVSSEYFRFTRASNRDVSATNWLLVGRGIGGSLAQVGGPERRALGTTWVRYTCKDLSGCDTREFPVRGEGCAEAVGAAQVDFRAGPLPDCSESHDRPPTFFRSSAADAASHKNWDRLCHD